METKVVEREGSVSEFRAAVRTARIAMVESPVGLLVVSKTQLLRPLAFSRNNGWRFRWSEFADTALALRAVILPVSNGRLIKQSLEAQSYDDT